ncbi:MAG: sulfotransferase [Pseudomonadota bacterium]
MSPDLRVAIARHKSGDLTGAISAYRKRLTVAPKDSTAQHYLGMALAQSGSIDEGLRSLKAAVDADPRSHLYQSNLGKAALRAERLELARDAFCAAVEIEPRDYQSHNNLGGLHRQAGELAAARDSYERAMSLKPHPAVALNLGLVEKQLDNREAARDAFRRVVKMRPGDIQARLQLAALDSEDGDFTPSSAWLAEAEARGPHDPRVLAAVLTQRGHQPTHDQLERSAALLNQSGIAETDRARLGFGLGRALQRLDRHDEAWTACAAANEIVARHAPYNADGLTGEVTRIMQTFTPDLISQLGGLGLNGEKLVFIVGLPRSGTTLAEQVLASHPAVHGADERPEIPALVAALGGSDGTYPESLRSCPASDIREVAQKALQSYGGLAPDAKRIIDKLPFNFSHVGLIAGLFPNARIIHCTRDLRDVFVSCFFTEFTDELQAFRTRADHFAHYATLYRKLMAHWEGLFPDRIHMLRYENMVGDFEPQARGLVEAVGLDWHPDCLNYAQTQRTVRTPSRWQVRQPIYTTSIGRWKSYAAYLAPVSALENSS